MFTTKMFNRLMTITVIACVQLTMKPTRAEPITGPAKIILRKVGECDDRGTNEIRITGTKLGKLGRDTYSYSTDIILLQTVTDEIHSVFNLAYFGNGGWKKNWMVNDLGGVCASFKLYVPQAANYVFKKLNITSCPIAAGNYTLNNITIKNPRFEIIPMLYNVYKMDLYFLKQGKRLGCKTIFFDIVKK